MAGQGSVVLNPLSYGWVQGSNDDLYYFRGYDPATRQLTGLTRYEFSRGMGRLTRHTYVEGATFVGAAADGRGQWRVTQGWTRELEIVGIGYRAEMKGKSTVVFNLGYSHPIEYPLPTGIEVAVDPKQTKLTLTGIDRQKVGQVAAEMRGLRPPDPYKNKGVRYAGERLKKKVGKTGAK